MKHTGVATRLFFSQPERETRDTARSAVISGILHAALIVAVVLLTRAGVMVVTGDLGVGTGIGTGAAGGGGGGGQDDVISLLISAPEEPEPVSSEDLVLPTQIDEEIPEPELEEPKIEDIELAIEKDSVPEPIIAAAPMPNPLGGTGTGEGTGTGVGTGPGTGPGSGGGTGGGSGGGIGSGMGPGTGRGNVMKPSPEVLLVPPTAPGNVRGKAVVVRLHVDSVGVVRGADIMPSTGNRKYDETLKRTALGWRFKPARDERNRPVAVLFDVTFTF